MSSTQPITNRYEFPKTADELITLLETIQRDNNLKSDEYFNKIFTKDGS